MYTTVAQVEVPESDDPAATATQASMEEWGTKEAAWEILKIHKFDAFMDSILAPFGLTLESSISRPTEAATSKTPKTKTPSRAEGNLSRAGPTSLNTKENNIPNKKDKEELPNKNRKQI